jgi:hypothetical protein
MLSDFLSPLHRLSSVLATVLFFLAPAAFRRSATLSLFGSMAACDCSVGVDETAIVVGVLLYASGAGSIVGEALLVGEVLLYASGACATVELGVGVGVVDVGVGVVDVGVGVVPLPLEVDEVVPTGTMVPAVDSGDTVNWEMGKVVGVGVLSVPGPSAVEVGVGEVLDWPPDVAESKAPRI